MLDWCRIVTRDPATRGHHFRNNVKINVLESRANNAQNPPKTIRKDKAATIEVIEEQLSTGHIGGKGAPSLAEVNYVQSRAMTIKQSWVGLPVAFKNILRFRIKAAADIEGVLVARQDELRGRVRLLDPRPEFVAPLLILHIRNNKHSESLENRPGLNDSTEQSDENEQGENPSDGH